jgi:hypothetical protein
MAQVQDPSPQPQWGLVPTNAQELRIHSTTPDGLCWAYSVTAAAGIGTDLDSYGQSPEAADILIQRVATHMRHSKDLVTPWSVPNTVGDHILERINTYGLKLQSVPLGARSKDDFKVQSIEEFADLLENRTSTHQGHYFINYYTTAQLDCILFLTAEVINRKITIVNERRELLSCYEPPVFLDRGQKPLDPEIFIMFTEGGADGRGGHFDALVDAGALPRLQQARAQLNTKQPVALKTEVEALLVHNGFNLPGNASAYDISRLNSAYHQLWLIEVQKRIAALQEAQRGGAAPQQRPPTPPLSDQLRAELARREAERLQRGRDADDERARAREATEAARRRTTELTMQLVSGTFDERAERRITSKNGRSILLQQRILYITDLATRIINANAERNATEWTRLLHLFFEALGPPENYLCNNMPKKSDQAITAVDSDSDSDDEEAEADDNTGGPNTAAEERKNAKVLARAIHFLQAPKETGVNLALLLNLKPPKELTHEAICLLQTKHPEPTVPQHGPRPQSPYDNRSDTEPLEIQWNNPTYRDDQNSVPGLKQVLYSAKPHVADLAGVSFSSIVNIVNAAPTIVAAALTHVTQAIAEGLPFFVTSGSPEYEQGARLVGTYLGMAICKIKDFQDTGDVRPILKLYRPVALVDAWLIAHPAVKRFFNDHTPTWQLYFQQAGTEAMALAIGELMAYLKSQHTEGYHATCDLENCFNLLDWEAIIELCDLCPVLRRFARLLYGNGPQHVHYRCLITKKEVLILNKTGGAQGAGLTAYLAASLLAPPQHLVALLFDCGKPQDPASDHHNTFMAFSDDGHASSTKADTCARMVLFMTENDPKYLTEEQKQRLPDALNIVFDQYKTRRTSLRSIGQKLKLSKLCVYSHHIMSAAHKAFFENLEVPHYLGGGTFSFKIIPPSEGIKVTGVPKGSRAFQEAWVKETCTNIVSLIETIPQMLTRGIGEGHRRVFLNYILRTGLATKLQFLMANVPRIACHGLRDVLRAYRVALTAIFDLDPEEALKQDDLHDARWLRTHLPEEQGGTAHTNPLDVQYAAYLGMLTRAAPLLPSLIPTVPLDWLTLHQDGPRKEAALAVDLLESQLCGKQLNDFKSKSRRELTLAALINGKPMSFVQRLLSNLVHESRRTEVEKRLPMHMPRASPDSDKDTALFRTQFLAGVLRQWAQGGNDTILASSIFTAHPLNPVSPNDSVLIYHALMRGGWSFNPHGAQHICRHCKKPIPRQLLLHHHNCTARLSTTGATERHNALVSAIHQFARLKGAWVLGGTFRGEPFLRNIFPKFKLKNHPRASQDARADWHISSRIVSNGSNGYPKIRIEQLYGDARVSSVTAASLERTLHSIGIAAQHGEDEKIAEYRKRYEGIEFNSPVGGGNAAADPVPCIHLLVIDTFLRVGRRSAKTLRAIASILAGQVAHLQVVTHRLTYSAIYSELKRILALTMQIYTAEAFYSSLQPDSLYANASAPPLPGPPRTPAQGQKRQRQQGGERPPPQRRARLSDSQNDPQDDPGTGGARDGPGVEPGGERPPSRRRARPSDSQNDSQYGPGTGGAGGEARDEPAPGPPPTAAARRHTRRNSTQAEGTPRPLLPITMATPSPARPRTGQATLQMVRPHGADPATGPYLTEDDIQFDVEYNADHLGEAHYARNENGYTFAGFLTAEAPAPTHTVQRNQAPSDRRLHLITRVAALVKERFPDHEPTYGLIEQLLERQGFQDAAVAEAAADYMTAQRLGETAQRIDHPTIAAEHAGRAPAPQHMPPSRHASARAARPAAAQPNMAAPPRAAAAATAPPTRAPSSRHASVRASAAILQNSQDTLADSEGQEDEEDDSSEVIYPSDDDDGPSDDDSDQGHPTRARRTTADTRLYYAVRVGRETGIFRTWEECSNSVQGFNGNSHKSFKTLQEAEDFLNGIDSRKRKRPTGDEPNPRPPPRRRDEDDDDNNGGGNPQPRQTYHRRRAAHASSSLPATTASATRPAGKAAYAYSRGDHASIEATIKALSASDRAVIEDIILDFGRTFSTGKFNWDIIAPNLPEGPLRELPRKALWRLKALTYKYLPGGMIERQRERTRTLFAERGPNFEERMRAQYLWNHSDKGRESRRKSHARSLGKAKLNPDFVNKRREYNKQRWQEIKEKCAANSTFDQERKDAVNLASRIYKARLRAAGDPALIAKRREYSNLYRQKVKERRATDSALDHRYKEYSRRQQQRIKDKRAADSTFDREHRNAANLRSRICKARLKAKGDPIFIEKGKEYRKLSHQRTKERRAADSAFDQKFKEAARLATKNYQATPKGKENRRENDKRKWNRIKAKRAADSTFDQEYRDAAKLRKENFQARLKA